MDKEGAFWHHFADMQDPRMDRTKRHKLVDILFIAAAVIAGADTFVEVEEYGKIKYERLKKAFPRTRFMMLLDGLYPNGPVWEEYRGLKKLIEKQDRLENTWGDRRQKFHCVNDIEYTYGPNGRKRQIVHVVVCEESWEEVDPQTEQIVAKHARHV